MLNVWPEGDEAYQGKLSRSPSIRLEGRGRSHNIKSLPVVMVLAWAVVSDDPTAMDKVKLFFDMFSQLPSWFTNLWILVVASNIWYKRNTNFQKWKKIIKEKTYETMTLEQDLTNVKIPNWCGSGMKKGGSKLKRKSRVTKIEKMSQLL